MKLKLHITSFVFVFVFSITSSAHASINLDPVWTHLETGTENWIAENISLGNYGNEAFTSLGVGIGYDRIFSAYDENTPTPVMEHNPTPLISNLEKAVDSGNESNVHASIQYVQTSSGSFTYKPKIKKFNSTGGLLWSWDFPFQPSSATTARGIGVSDNGNTIVGWAKNPSNGNLGVAKFQGSSGVPVSFNEYNTLGTILASKLSSDGRFLSVASQLKNIVVNLETNQVVFEKLSVQAFLDVAISGDGQVIAYSLIDQKIYVYKWNGSSYVLSLTLNSPNSHHCRKIDISQDGSLMVLGCANSTSEILNIVGVDLNLGGSIVLNDISQGSGQYSNLPTEIAISKDATTFAVSTWGDENEQAPDLLVYTKGRNGWERSAEFTHEGSIMAMEMYAKNGVGIISTASKLIHANEWGGGGRVDLFEIGDGLTLHDVPHQNQTSTFEFEAQAGTVLLSTSLASEPIFMSGVGNLYLNPQGLIALPPGTANAQGIVEISHSFNYPPGTVLYAQAVKLSPRREFLDHFLKVVVY